MGTEKTKVEFGSVRKGSEISSYVPLMEGPLQVVTLWKIILDVR